MIGNMEEIGEGDFVLYEDAHSEITRLRAENEELRQAMPEWIDVREQPICTLFREYDPYTFDINIDGYFIAEIGLYGSNDFYIVRIADDGMLWDMGKCDIGYDWRAVTRYIPLDALPPVPEE